MWFLFHRGYWRILQSELCNLYFRMEIARRNSLHHYGIPLVLPSELYPQRHPLRRSFVRVRRRGIRKLRSIHSRASLVDLFLLVNLLVPDLFRGEASKVAEYFASNPDNG